MLSRGDLVGKVMVRIPMRRLISAHGHDHFAQPGVFGQRPVILGNLRGRDVLDPACINLSQILRVAHHGLRDHDDPPLYPCWLSDFDERHQMHTLVVGLFQMLADPTLIVADMANGAQALTTTRPV